ncbi:MAG: DUF389 domain-containing protein [Alistipes sp.]|nr:DUF389 domain-containing protein [Alistipes sp.]
MQKHSSRRDRMKGLFSRFLRNRFSLEEDKAPRDEVAASISKGVEFRGVNLWILIFATMTASLGLNVNSPAVIIGAMLISPIMGPIIGAGLALGINDFDLLKKSLRNFALMMTVAMVASTLYFLISPLSANSSELLARTTPTAYDVLIALFGGMAGMVAQSRRDKSSTVIPGVAIATALIPPLCTAGFGIATWQLRFFIGALYLFLINSVFIAMASYIIVRLLKYQQVVLVDKARQRRRNAVMAAIMLVVFIPSVIIGLRMVHISLFEAKADRFVSQVFNFPQTRVIEKTTSFGRGKEPSRIELLLVGETLDESVIENARTQLDNYGLESSELVVRQAGSSDRVDIISLQHSYAELIAEKNRRIDRMSAQLEHYRLYDTGIEGISREAGVVIPNLGSMSLTKGVSFDSRGAALDTLLICVFSPADPSLDVDRETFTEWLRIRTGIDKVKLFVETESR